MLAVEDFVAALDHLFQRQTIATQVFAVAESAAIFLFHLLSLLYFIAIQIGSHWITFLPRNRNVMHLPIHGNLKEWDVFPADCVSASRFYPPPDGAVWCHFPHSDRTLNGAHKEHVLGREMLNLKVYPSYDAA